MPWTAALAATVWSTFAAAGNVAEEANARLPASAGSDRPSVRPTGHRGSGIPGTGVFHGADGMVIRATVPGAAAPPAHGAAAPAALATPRVKAAPVSNAQAPVGGGFTPEE